MTPKQAKAYLDNLIDTARINLSKGDPIADHYLQTHAKTLRTLVEKQMLSYRPAEGTLVSPILEAIIADKELAYDLGVQITSCEGTNLQKEKFTLEHAKRNRDAGRFSAIHISDSPKKNTVYGFEFNQDNNLLAEILKIRMRDVGPSRSGSGRL